MDCVCGHCRARIFNPCFKIKDAGLFGNHSCVTVGNMDKSVFIVVLNYKNLEDTIACLASLRKITYNRYRIVVVDNDSQDGSYESLKEQETDCCILQSGENRGYAAGNNIGIRYALEQGADYVCILNNDVEVEPDFLTKLVQYMESEPDVGMTGPVVYEYDQREKIQSAGFSICVRTGRAQPLWQGKHKKELSGKHIIVSDGLSGTCLLVRREVLEKAGLIPECYFLFFEEMEWCLHVQKAGYKLVTVADAGVYHKGSATVNKMGTVSRHYMARNRVLFVRRNGTPAEEVLFLLGQTPFYFLRTLFSSKKEIRKLELAAFLEGIRMDKKGNTI